MKTSYCPNCQATVRVHHDYGAGYSDLYYCGVCDTELNYNFKFCILAAGRGTRNNERVQAQAIVYYLVRMSYKYLSYLPLLILWSKKMLYLILLVIIGWVFQRSVWKIQWTIV